MFKKPSDLARAALELLKLADLTEPRTALELSAAILANHVSEWHCRHTRTKRKDAQHDFEQKHPEWPTLREIANGTKHPYPGKVDVSEANLREPEWEDHDFWHATPDPPTLFVGVNGRERSIYVMTYQFCHRYLDGARYGLIGHGACSAAALIIARRQFANQTQYGWIFLPVASRAMR